MRYTLGTASVVVGKSKSTILRAIKDGRLSYESKEGNSYQIEPSELFRVFPKKVSRNVPMEQKSNDVERSMAQTERQLLQDKIRFLEKLVEEEKEEKNRLLSLLENQTKQLTDQRKKRWWF